MSYKIFLFDALSPIEWSQAGWKLEGDEVNTDDCEIEFIHDPIMQHVPKQGLIVDAGCGVARWPIYLRRRGYRVFGLEWSHDACRIAKRTDPGLEVLRSDVRHIPLADGSVDALLSLGVVEHDESGPLPALHEARRVLRAGGIMVLAVPYNNPLRRVLVNRLQSYVTRQRRQADWKLGFAEYRFSGAEVKSFLDQTGFDVVAWYPNDLRPPKNMGMWVDYNNLTLNPFVPMPREQLFILPGIAGRIAAALTRYVPWLVCGEVICIARAR